MPIKPSTRLFNCLRCHQQVMICQQCDHGQRYCANECRQLARKSSLKRCNRKYQNSLKGRFNNAERQRRFRKKKQLEKRVTDQSSPSKQSRDLLLSKVCALKNRSKIPTFRTKTVCHFCGVPGGPFFRVGFLKKRTIYPCRSKRVNDFGENKHGH